LYIVFYNWLLRARERSNQKKKLRKRRETDKEESK